MLISNLLSVQNKSCRLPNTDSARNKAIQKCHEILEYITYLGAGSPVA